MDDANQHFDFEKDFEAVVDHHLINEFFTRCT